MVYLSLVEGKLVGIIDVNQFFAQRIRVVALSKLQCKPSIACCLQNSFVEWALLALWNANKRSVFATPILWVNTI